MGKGNLTITPVDQVAAGEEAKFQTTILTTINTEEMTEATKKIIRVVRTAIKTEEIEDNILREKMFTKKKKRKVIRFLNLLVEEMAAKIKVTKTKIGSRVSITSKLDSSFNF
jgi:hypothetical protein